MFFPHTLTELTLILMIKKQSCVCVVLYTGIRQFMKIIISLKTLCLIICMVAGIFDLEKKIED